MFKSIIAKWNVWLMPVVLVLFVLQAVMLPWTVGLTWAGRSESPAHVLTYTRNKLTWDTATGVRPDGTAELNLFSTEYDGTVLSANGDKLIAPGTEQSTVMRLKNDVRESIRYTAVLYEIKSDPSLPVRSDMLSEGAAAATEYYLPDGMQDAVVLKAITGTVDGGQIQDFDISWKWVFEESNEQDIADTAFGMLAADTITLGFYLVVEDSGSPWSPPFFPIETEPTPEPETEPETETETEPETEPETETETETEPETEPETQPESEPETEAPAEEPEPITPVLPESPQTGDSSPVGLYVTLLVAAFVLLILLCWDAMQAQKHEENE